MENCDKTAEHLEMAAVKVGNHTNAMEDFDRRRSQIDCLYWRQVVNHDPRI